MSSLLQSSLTTSLIQVAESAKNMYNYIVFLTCLSYCGDGVFGEACAVKRIFL